MEIRDMCVSFFAIFCSWIFADKFVHFVVKLLHARHSSVFFKKHLVHISHGVVIVSHVSIINRLLQNLQLLLELSLRR